MSDYDLVVIGGGPAGQKAAVQAAKTGARVVIASLSFETFIDSVFNFPTFAEAYRVAAFDLLKQMRTRTSAKAAAE